MLASALSPVEVEGSSPASLPLSSLDAEKLQALAEASEDRLLPSESLKNAVVKIEAVYSEGPGLVSKLSDEVTQHAMLP